MVEQFGLLLVMVTAKLICVFVFANAKSLFSHDAAHILYNSNITRIFAIHV